jgi:hypothetical protein
MYLIQNFTLLMYIRGIGELFCSIGIFSIKHVLRHVSRANNINILN